MRESLRFISERIQRNNQISKLNIEAKIPRVGIFWFVDGEVLGYDKAWKEVIVLREEDEEHFDINESHYSFWDRIKKLKPSLKHYEYEDYPRGRVVAVKKNGITSFKVITSSDLINNPEFKTALRKEYNLPPNTEWVNDIHYENPAQIDWDNL